MKKVLVGALACLLSLISASTLGWTGKGHAWLAKQVWPELSRAQQASVGPLFFTIYPEEWKSESKTQQQFWRDAFIWSSTAADGWRSLSLDALYRRYGAKTPSRLKKYGALNTSDWHYVNFTYPPSRANHCPAQGGFLFKGIDALEGALKEKLTDVQRAITLALMLHMIQDAHQPLHTATQVGPGCRSDRGGNLSCFRDRAAKSRQCDTSLHQAWDRGFGVFRKRRVQMEWQETDGVSLEKWARGRLSDMDIVYRKRDKHYEKRARELVDRRVQRAVSMTRDSVDHWFPKKSRKRQ